MLSDSGPGPTGPVILRTERLGKEYSLGPRRQVRTLRDLLASAWRSREGAGGGLNAPHGNRWALRDVDLEIHEGEIVGLVGANGAGKSTLLKILSRIVYPTEGIAEVRGRVGSLLEVGTGFHPELTGRENVFLSGALLGMRRDEIRTQFDEIVAFSEVETHIDMPVKHYSSGMYLRLGFAVAAHLRPEILMVDEVLAVGDVAFQRKCLGKMSQVSDAGRTVIFVSHNMAAVTRLCARAVWLHHGRVRRIGDARDVVAAYLAEMAPTVPERTWGDSGPGDGSMRLESVGIRGAEASVALGLTQDQPLTVSIRYRVLRPIPDSNVGVELKAADGTTVFTSLDSDHGGTEGRPRRPGTYEATCTIPAHLLNEGRYYLSFTAGIPFISLCFRADDALAIEVGPPLPATGEKARLPVKKAGVIDPLLDWNVRPAGGDSGSEPPSTCGSK